MFRAGHTPKRGDHQESVARGVKFLLDKARREKEAWSFVEESAPFDSHALATIMLCEAMLCEAYGTRFQKLRDMKATVRRTIAHGLQIQNPDGGWGHHKTEMVSTAWYLFALGSYHQSGLDLPPDSVKRLMEYVDSARPESGTDSRLSSPETGHKRVTAARLFCRIRTGNPVDAPVNKAIDRLAERGYSKDDLIYNFFAGETLIRHGTTPLHRDKRWQRWNVNLRDWLVAQQVKAGHERGSWTPDGSLPEALAGGRLYATAMATLILTTYYVPRWCNCGRGGHHYEEDDFPL